MRIVLGAFVVCALGQEADPPGQTRDGNLLHVGVPSPWGSRPYGMTRVNAAPTDGSRLQGTFYTDDTANGYRIRKALLDMHNYVRKVEAPAAKYMTKLIWDFHLEAFSRQWGEKLCNDPNAKFFEHSPDSSNGMPAWPYRIATGENLYTSSVERSPDEDFADVVSKWYAERQDYDWSTGNAKPGAKGPVGHYKQLVRAPMTAVGCSVVSGCHNGNGWQTYVICHYDYGNVGKDPYEPATAGSSTCSSCPSGYSCCEQGLCSGQIPVGATALEPFAPALEKTEEWYGCKNWKRTDCHGTGATVFTDKLDNDDSDLEFLQCHCGKGPSPTDFYDTVRHGYFWFRNHCFQAVQGTSSDDLTQAEALADLSLKSQDVYIDGVHGKDFLKPPPSAESAPRHEMATPPPGGVRPARSLKKEAASGQLDSQPALLDNGSEAILGRSKDLPETGPRMRHFRRHGVIDPLSAAEEAESHAEVLQRKAALAQKQLELAQKNIEVGKAVDELREAQKD